VRDARNSYEEGNPELKIIVDREKAAYYGLSVADVAATVRAYIDGNVSTHLRQGDDEYDIRVILPEGQHGSAEDVLGMPILSADGKLIRLRQVAHTEDVLGPTVIERYDKSRSISVSGNLGSRTLGPVLEDIRAARARINIPPGVDVVESGEAEDLKNTIRDLIIALLLSVLLVYMLMVALFESYIYPFIIMFSLPVALIGALAALALTGKSLSVMSMIGIIMLMGLVAKNAILIVDYTNTLRQRGMELREALQEAGKIRLRPIMMTTMAMVFGMLPLALALGEGSEIRSGMGVVIIGGLLSSLVLTVVLVPVVYTIVEDFRMAWRRLLRKGV
jgi:HAE1 family hydrophobic/amphiphilic exporter-1